jgi:hypothetical protein
VLSLLAFAAFLLYRAAKDIQLASAEIAQAATATTQLNTAQLKELRLEVSAGLHKLDATSLQEAAVSIQRTGKNLAATTTMLYKLVLSQEGSAGVIEDTLQSEISPVTGLPITQQDLERKETAQALINEIHQRRSQAAEIDDRVPVQPAMDIEEAWQMDEDEF